MSDVISAVSAAGKIVDVAEKGSGVLGHIADYWGLGRWLDRRSRSKDVDAAVKVYESLYGTDMPKELKDLVYAMYLTEARKLGNVIEVFSIVRGSRRGRENDGTVPERPWLDVYFDGASHAYDGDVRAMWAQLLNGEIDSPGSFSMRALRTLTDMSANEAELFRYLCSWSVEWRTEDRDRWRPLPLLATQTDNLGDGTVYANGPWHRELAPLEHANLTSQANGDVYAGDIAFESPLHMRYRSQGKWVELTLKPTNASSRFGSGYAFTAVGVELSALCDSELGSADGLEELVTEYAEMGGYEIVRRGDGEPDSD